MVKTKKYKIIAINLGKQGDPARELIELYEKKYGKQGTSEVIRKAIIYHLSADKQFEEYKIRQAIEDRKGILGRMQAEQKLLLENSDKLEKMGVDPLGL